MQIIIDRFEDGFAVVELPDGTFVNIPEKLVKDASEGDVFDIVKNIEKKQKKEKEFEELINKLFE